MLHADQPAWYRVRLQGVLDSDWSTFLQGMDVVRVEDSTVTVLVGEVMDQAALMGVLNFVYNLGYPLLSVEYVGAAREVCEP